MKITKGKIVDSGCGGFLCPPYHPMHSKSVQIDLRRHVENRRYVSLEDAVYDEELDESSRFIAKSLLQTWEKNKLPLDSPLVQTWILQVMGYFKGCFCSGDGTNPNDWLVENLLVEMTGPSKRHAGVHHIRQYYPTFTPHQVHYRRAHWTCRKAI